jgi:hypothetical protein
LIGIVVRNGNDWRIGRRPVLLLTLNMKAIRPSLVSGWDPPQNPGSEAYGRDSMPSWSPDGDEIAFMRRYRGRTDIYAIRLDGVDGYDHLEICLLRSRILLS